MVSLNPFTNIQYRRFGWLLATALGVTAWRVSSTALLAIAVLTIGVATIWPLSLRRPHVWLTWLTRPVGLLVSQLLLALVFFALITPLALLFRLLGRDLLNCRPNPDATTYWRSCTPKTDASSYLRQF